MHTRQCLELLLRLCVQQFVGVLHAGEVGVAILTGFDDVHAEVSEQLFFERTVVVPLRPWPVDAHPVVVRQPEDVRVR